MRRKDKSNNVFQCGRCKQYFPQANVEHHTRSGMFLCLKCYDEKLREEYTEAAKADQEKDEQDR
jgi:transcription initiation factor IIE alpha subunit